MDDEVDGVLVAFEILNKADINGVAEFFLVALDEFGACGFGEF